MTERRLIDRHRLWGRVTHWLNVICMRILLMSGLQIFNAHPTLYWDNSSHFDNPLLVIRAFPAWATLPGIEWLAMGRRWHLFFAWLFVTNGTRYGLLLARSISYRLMKSLLAERAVAERRARTLTPSGLPRITRQHLVFRNVPYQPSAADARIIG